MCFLLDTSTQHSNYLQASPKLIGCYHSPDVAGDKQSVSTLADLAKHAQIFNLQNWLHSGNQPSDDEHASDTCSSTGKPGDAV